MTWWLFQQNRAGAERIAIADLEEQVPWLTNVKWRLASGLHLVADFDIIHLGEPIGFTITYPNFFPDMPPQVCPREEVQLSRHQYGPGGELCLEYRPDNWEPSVTGAMMIESAYRLLTTEQPEVNVRSEVESAHRVTIAQLARTETLRFLLPSRLVPHLALLPQDVPHELVVEELYSATHYLCRVKRLGDEENPIFSEPAHFSSSFTRPGFAINVSPSSELQMSATYDFLEAFAGSVQSDELAGRIRTYDKEQTFLFYKNGISKLLSLAAGSGRRHVFDYRTIPLPNDQPRLSKEYEALSEKKVAILGCGSVGSKVASSLARSGVASFVLIDGDLLLPGNVVRHDLDNRSVGLNKPDAVKARILDINPVGSVTVRRVLLGGQESSASAEAALESISQCDLIVDATADAQIFNLCASVALTYKKPLVWAEVFAGGIGGLVARSRPDVDPTPHAARRQIATWCSEHGVPWDDSSIQYDLTRDDLPPLIADDADVTVIAAHLTRMTVDVLTREETIFPNSAYLIGLKQEWIFSAPFDTWPIDLITEGDWGRTIIEDTTDEFNALFSEIIPKSTEPEDAA